MPSTKRQRITGICGPNVHWGPGHNADLMIQFGDGWGDTALSRGDTNVYTQYGLSRF